MAKTELYDRTLTKRRTQYDPTEAFIDGYMRGLAVAFAQYVRSDVAKKYCITPIELVEEIGRHKSYSAQMWIDEYERLQQGGE